VLLAASPLLDGIGGPLFRGLQPVPTGHRAPRQISVAVVAPYAVDPDNAERLWDVSLKLIA